MLVRHARQTWTLNRETDIPYKSDLDFVITSCCCSPELVLSSPLQSLSAQPAMCDVTWDHGPHGFFVHLSTRIDELTLQSNRSVTSIDIEFEDGPTQAADPEA